MDYKKNKKAVALGYDSKQDSAPKVLATGKGLTAEKILEIAKENDVPLYEDTKLVENLINLDLSQEIPEELYKIISEVLVFIYSLDKS